MTLCRDFMKGHCPRGVLCRFSHHASISEEVEKRVTWPEDIPTFQPAANSHTSADGFAQKLRPSAPDFQSQSDGTVPGRVPLWRPQTTNIPPQSSPAASTHPISVPIPVARKLSANSTLKIDAPAQRERTPSRGAVVYSRPECKFHVLGKCAKGSACSFKHSVSSVVAGTSVGVERENSSTESKVKDTPVFRRELKGVTATFSDGAHVTDVELASDFSVAQIIGLPESCTMQNVTGLLEVFGFTVAPEDIRLRSFDGRTVAELKVKDPAFSDNLVRKFHKELGTSHGSELTVTKIQVAGASSEVGNRMQLSSVTCAWYKPSRTLWLHYKQSHIVHSVKEIIDSQPDTLFGGNIQCSITAPRSIGRRGRYGGETSIFSVQLSGLMLDNSATKRILNRLLTGSRKPFEIKWGPSTPDMTQEALEAKVRTAVEKHAATSWELLLTPNAPRAKAIVRFASRKEALLAVKDLHMSLIPNAGGQKLLLSQTISLKFGLLTDIYNTITEELGALQRDLCADGRVHINVYPPATPRSAFSTIKISGNEFGKVAAAQKAIKKLLDGDIAMHEDDVIWAPFFNTGDGLKFLKQLALELNIYISRDLQYYCLRMYGPHRQKERAVSMLRGKLQELANENHVLELSPQLLKRAMAGGLKELRETFGAENVKLFISGQDNSIAFRGSKEDFNNAVACLLSTSSTAVNKLQNEGDECCICYTEPTDPTITPCKHVYCKGCLESQCVSSGGDYKPLNCYGGNGSCDLAIPLRFLHTVVTSQTFEGLLESSFKNYVKTHPEDLQYCPTADCTQVYRKGIPNKGSAFDCPTCLASICTVCQDSSHGDMTCAEFARISNDGTGAFEEWKKEKGVRDCPVCKTAIEKTYGCNHMECLGCKTHICWFCMMTFQGQDAGPRVYDHMKAEHDGFYPGRR